MKAIGYIRVSTQNQVDDGISLEAQKDAIKTWCLANNYDLVNVFMDTGISGKSVNNREGLKQALDAIENGMALVAYSLSRISRSTKDMILLAEKLAKKGADLVSITEKIDTTSASGKMIFKMLAVLNEFERDLISERTKTALAHKKVNGQVYSPIPFGFGRIEGRLVKVEREAKLISEIMRMRDQGHTLRAIADTLNRRGVAGKKGGRWYALTVSYLIQRQVHVTG